MNRLTASYNTVEALQCLVKDRNSDYKLRYFLNAVLERLDQLVHRMSFVNERRKCRKQADNRNRVHFDSCQIAEFANYMNFELSSYCLGPISKSHLTLVGVFFNGGVLLKTIFSGGSFQRLSSCS